MNRDATDKQLEEMLEEPHHRHLAVFTPTVSPHCQLMVRLGPGACQSRCLCPRPPQAEGVSHQALSEIERRHRDIASLQSSIEELADIWRHVAALVESQVTCTGKGGGDSEEAWVLRQIKLTAILSVQGELMDNIERNVASAVEYVKVSEDETAKAVWYKRNPYKVFRRTNQKPSH